MTIETRPNSPWQTIVATIDSESEKAQIERLDTVNQIREFVKSRGQIIDETTRKLKLEQVLTLLGNTGIVVTGRALKEYVCTPDTVRHLSVYMSTVKPMLARKNLRYRNITPVRNQPAEYLVESIPGSDNPAVNASSERATNPAITPKRRNQFNPTRKKLPEKTETPTEPEPYLADHRREDLWHSVTQTFIEHSIKGTLSEVSQHALIIGSQIQKTLPVEQKPLTILAGITRNEARQKAAYEIVAGIARSNNEPSVKLRLIEQACDHFGVPLPKLEAQLWNVVSVSPLPQDVYPQATTPKLEKVVTTDKREHGVTLCPCCHQGIFYTRDPDISKDLADLYVIRTQVDIQKGTCTHPEQTDIRRKTPAPQPTREGHHDDVRAKKSA